MKKFVEININKFSFKLKNLIIDFETMEEGRYFQEDIPEPSEKIIKYKTFVISNLLIDFQSVFINLN